MRIRPFASTVAAAVLGAAAPLVAQNSQYPPPMPQMMQEMAAMHCGGGMGDMMHGMAGMMYRTPSARADTMMRGMIRDMMRMMGPPTPGMILDYKDELKLTSNQVNQLTELQKNAETPCLEHMRLAMQAHQAANQLLEVDKPNFTAFTAKLKEGAEHMVQAHVTMAKAAVAARQDLTAGQRQTLNGLMQRTPK